MEKNNKQKHEQPSTLTYTLVLCFYPRCSNSVRMEDMLWIEDIVDSTQTF
jgi:hypothetical protein